MTLPIPRPRVFIHQGKLVLTLRDAVNPVVWQADLGVIQSALLEVVPTGGSQVQLRYKTADGSITEIALFGDRAQGIAVLEDIQTILFSPENISRSTSQSLKKEHVILTLIAIGLFLALTIFLFNMTHIDPSTQNKSGVAAAAVGVPQDADSLLEGP